MPEKEIGFFAEGPRTIEDLSRPHTLEQERPFEIVKTISLSVIDYENFITDMKADRQFIEDHSTLCAQGEIWKCLLVRQRGSTSGVLVMPKAERFVGWAALWRGEETTKEETDR